jgi:aminoglycoside phosphotransferase (APT) family kinase protein
VIDLDRLAAWLDVQDVPGKGAPIEHRLVTGGAQNEIYEIRRGDDLHAALRIPPLSAPAARDAGILREWRIVEGLGGTDVPQPEALAVCEDTSVLGRTFYLMDFVDGWSPMSARTWPVPFDTDREARSGLASELIDGIALLSRVDWRAQGLAKIGRRELPGFEETKTWLRAHRPIDYIPGVLHGDYQFANVMYRHGAPARLAAILDWEMGTIGDPKLDLAWVIDKWPADTSSGEGGFSYVDMTGMPGRDTMIARYAEVSGRQVDDLDYYLILSRFKLAIVIEQGFQRAGDNPTLQAFGPVALDLMSRAADLAASTRYSVTESVPSS